MYFYLIFIPLDENDVLVEIPTNIFPTNTLLNIIPGENDTVGGYTYLGLHIIQCYGEIQNPHPPQPPGLGGIPLHLPEDTPGQRLTHFLLPTR